MRIFNQIIFGLVFFASLFIAVVFFHKGEPMAFVFLALAFLLVLIVRSSINHKNN